MAGSDLGDRLFHNAEISDAIIAWRDLGLHADNTVSQLCELAEQATKLVEELRPAILKTVTDLNASLSKSLAELNATIAESRAVAAKVNRGLAAMGAPPK